MKTEVIRDWSRVEQLSGSWNALLRQSSADSIFLTWEWIKAWIDVVGRRHEPLVAAVFDAEGALCGLAPFYTRGYRLLGAVPYRVLHVLGDMSAEYPDLIVRRNVETEALAALFQALSSHPRLWDCLWLPSVSGWNGAFERLSRQCTTHRMYRNVRPFDFSSIALPPTAEDYDRMLTPKRRKDLQRTKDRILGGGKGAVTRCSTLGEVPAYLEALFRLHAARWRRQGDQGAFGPEKMAIYHRFVRSALNTGWLRLYGLQHEGAFKAVQIGYVYNGVFHALQEGFDPDFTPGVGNVLRYEAIRACIAEGLRCYDFLGTHTEHKRMWCALPREGYSVFIGRPSLRNALLFKAKVWPTGRYLKPAAERPALLEEYQSRPDPV